MQLADIIKQKIRKEGPISFHDFMEMALYYPETGYYTAATDKTGATGDYYTSPDLGPVFGMTLGRQLEEIGTLLAKKDFTIVEYGAGKGMLCHDILNYLQKNNKPLYESVHYCIIEKSPALRQKAQQHLKEKVEWFNKIAEVPYDISCILSNEMIDNLAVHQVVMQKELMEVFVTYQNGFKECLQPAGTELKDYFTALKVKLPEGFRTEVNLEAAQWIGEAAAALKKGFIITIDYGYLSSELYKSCRSNGTLMCYQKHDVNDQPYRAIGEQDITAHINFSALIHYGAQNGLACCGLVNQAFFLLALGFKNYFKRPENNKENTIRLALQEARLTHTLLMDMGIKYKVLIQRKGIPECTLSGLKYLAPAAAFKTARP